MKEYYRHIGEILSDHLPQPDLGESVEHYALRADDLYVSKGVQSQEKLRTVRQEYIVKIGKLKGEIHDLRKDAHEFKETLSKTLGEPCEPERVLELKHAASKQKDLDDAIENYPDREFAHSVTAGIDTLLEWREKEKHRDRSGYEEYELERSLID